ncbi:hypothetical protein OC844_001932 [Tilletia horrida]|nr:hypothetical protein OC844_001932 [Tilletia horrida]
MSSAAVLVPDTPRGARTRPVSSQAGPSRSTSQNANAVAAAALAAARMEARQQSRGSGLLAARPGRKREEERSRRDENLAVIIDDIPVGPQDFPPPPGDPKFQRLEPYSGIRLRNRALPFADFQHLMEGRHYVSASMLYSMVQKMHSSDGVRSFQRDGNYSLPIEGDWVIIGVLAEKSQIRMTKGAQRKGSDVEDADDPAIQGLGPNRSQSKKKQVDEEENPYNTRRVHQSRKYMAWKLVDFGSASSAPSGDGPTRGTDGGDCVLSLQLFASDDIPEAPKADESKNHVREEIRAALRSDPVKVYRGGSRGAFEKYWKEREGTVVAIINPRIMERGTVNQVNNNRNLLTITPTNAASIHVIGRSLDHSQCQALRKDGHRCPAWVDARTGTGVCDFHLEQGVSVARKGRQEFAVGTSGGGSWQRRRGGGATDNADDIFALKSSQGQGKGGWRGKKGDFPGMQPQHWDQSVEQGMNAGMASSSSSFARKRAFVVEGAGTWHERSSKVQADGRGPAIGDIHFDVAGQYGREKEEKKERLRTQAATIKMEEELKQRASSHNPRPSVQPVPVEVDDSADWILQGTSTASQALREAKRVLEYKQELAIAAAEEAAQKGTKTRKSRLFNTNEDALLAAALTKNAKERYRADDGSAPAKRPRWAYSAEAIQKMGFDPLAGAPGRTGAVPVWKENETAEQASKSKLLARVSGPTTDLPPPSMRRKLPKDGQKQTVQKARSSTLTRPYIQPQPKPAPLAAPFSRASNTKGDQAKPTASRREDSGSELDWSNSEDDAAPAPAQNFGGRGFFSDEDKDDDFAWERLERDALRQTAAKRARPHGAAVATSASYSSQAHIPELSINSDSELEFE